MRKFAVAVILYLCFTVSSNAQVVNFHFIKWNNKEVQNKLQSHKYRLAFLLGRNGFNSNDTVNVYFHHKEKYILVLSNDTKKSEMLYRQFIVYTSAIHQSFRYYAFLRYLVYIRAGYNLYYRSLYITSSLNNKVSSMNDGLFIKHLSKHGIKEKYLKSSTSTIQQCNIIY